MHVTVFLGLYVLVSFLGGQLVGR